MQLDSNTCRPTANRSDPPPAGPAAERARPLAATGSVFFPEGQYVGVRVVAVEKPGGATVDVFGPMVRPATD